MKRGIIDILLKALNSRFLNPTPCHYGYIGNVDAFSYDNLASEEKQRPGISVKTILEEADRFRSCPLRKGSLTVLEPDGASRDATLWDLHELRRTFAQKEYNSPGDRQRFGE